MTIETKCTSRRTAPAAAAALAALLLAGCSTGHIGETWQCPLAEGGSCDSVAAADPAVPDPQAAGGTVLAEPLWRVPTAETNAPPERSCAADCGAGFDPFAWLGRLFTAEAREGEAPLGGRSAPEPATAAARPPDPESGRQAGAPAEPADSLPAPGSGPGQASELGGQAAGPPRDEAADDNLAAGGLRTGEVVARIWIAPFVDGNGVYREASHVRVVLEPAGWRLR